MKLFYLYIIMLFVNSIYSQNYIDNGDFENGDFYNGFNTSPGGSASAFKYGISSWESRARLVVYKNTENSFWHSPDWYKGDYIYDYHDISPYSGNYYIGMKSYELIEQGINLEANTQYVLDLNVYLKYTDYSGYLLNVYLAKNKVKYRKENNLNWLGGKRNIPSCICCEKKRKHKTGWGQGYLDIAFFNLNSLPRNEWVNLVKNFSITNSVNISSFDWIVVELINSNSSCGGYVLIDDISLVKGCDNGCSSTDGLVSVVTNGLTNEDQMLKIYGLENVKKIR